MHISQVRVENFRLLRNTTMDVKDELCLVLGRNNTGKTSLLVLLEKFYNNHSFDFNDFPVSLREKILSIDSTTDVIELSIKLVLKIRYEENDNLSNLSEFIMDLSPESNDINILFECSVNTTKLLKALGDNPQITKGKFIKKYISNYLDNEIYIFENDDDLNSHNRHRLIRKDIKEVKRLIDFEIIHAKRGVSSSEEKNGRKVLSGLTTKYYNNLNSSTPSKFEDINVLMEEMDGRLEDQYAAFFTDFTRSARDFLSLDNLKVVSNLSANELINDSSEVVYGDIDSHLPEHLNGLGYMNVLYLLLSIEIKKNKFKENDKDIKLLLIEEPEAHTHPQLQHIFAMKITEMLKGVSGLQTIITTHSPQMIVNHSFENIRYMFSSKDSSGANTIEIKNFYSDLMSKYNTELDNFQFLKQYLTIEAAGLLFASKVIFIEGISENMLLPLFIAKYDKQQIDIEEVAIKADPNRKREYIPISSQNISILQVGANAKAFRHFLEFLGISALIITDIDTVKKKVKKNEKTEKNLTSYPACSVFDSPVNTSNETLKYYFDAPELSDNKNHSLWLEKLISKDLPGVTNLVKVSYQGQEGSYHARSFEDAFINTNKSKIGDNLNSILGIKKLEKSEYDEYKNEDIYELTEALLNKKSDFAASLLYLEHTGVVSWDVPKYIQEGLSWIQNN